MGGERPVSLTVGAQGPRLLQGEGCLLTLTTTILLYILIKPNEIADIWPVLSYKNVCFLSSILYCSLAVSQNKTKFCLPAAAFQTHTAPNGRSASPLWPCIFPRSPKDLSFSHEPCTEPSGLVLAIWLSHLPGLVLSSLIVLLLGWIGIGGVSPGWVPCLLFSLCSPRPQPPPSPVGPTLGMWPVGIPHPRASGWTWGRNSHRFPSPMSQMRKPRLGMYVIYLLTNAQGIGPSTPQLLSFLLYLVYMMSFETKWELVNIFQCPWRLMWGVCG